VLLPLNYTKKWVTKVGKPLFLLQLLHYLKEIGEPKWWIVFTYLPIVGPIMMTVFHLFLMKKFGRTTTAEKLLTIFLPFIYLAYQLFSTE
jgi:hypothetical protein